MGYSYLQPAGASTFRPFDYLGFRYLQIDDPGEALAVSDVVALLRHTAVPGSATFASSDATVDAVWRLGQHSALFSAQEYFVDTPTREKGPWLWDGFNSSQTTMAAFTPFVTQSSNRSGSIPDSSTGTGIAIKPSASSRIAWIGFFTRPHR